MDRPAFSNQLTVLLVATLGRVGLTACRRRRGRGKKKKEKKKTREKARLFSPPTTSAMRQEPAKSSSEHNATNKLHRG